MRNGDVGAGNNFNVRLRAANAATRDKESHTSVCVCVCVWMNAITGRGSMLVIRCLIVCRNIFESKSLVLPMKLYSLFCFVSYATYECSETLSRIKFSPFPCGRQWRTLIVCNAMPLPLQSFQIWKDRIWGENIWLLRTIIKNSKWHLTQKQIWLWSSSDVMVSVPDLRRIYSRDRCHICNHHREQAPLLCPHTHNMFPCLNR